MRVSKYIKLDKDVLLEWVYDDDDFLQKDYTIITDTLRNTRSFANTTSNNNSVNRQLFLIDKRKWGLVDNNRETNKYPFIQFLITQTAPPNLMNVLDLVFATVIVFKLQFLNSIQLFYFHTL